MLYPSICFFYIWLLSISAEAVGMLLTYLFYARFSGRIKALLRIRLIFVSQALPVKIKSAVTLGSYLFQHLVKLIDICVGVEVTELALGIFLNLA